MDDVLIKYLLDYLPKAPASKGAFYPSITLKAPKTNPNNWQYHPPPTPKLNHFSRPNKSKRTPLKVKPDTSFYYLYKYIYPPIASTKYIAHYHHHGCHWLY
jgi:hypothetical protein